MTPNAQTTSSTQPRWVHHALFGMLVLVCAALFWRPLHEMVRLGVDNDAYSITLVIPFLSAAFFYFEKNAVWPEARFDVLSGAILLIAGAVVAGVSFYAIAPNSPYALTAGIFPLVVLVVGCFALCYGLRVMRAAAFPLGILVLMVPLPTFAIDKIIVALQYWSADGAALLFRTVGVPFHRSELVFQLPTVNIRVAEECSGIRSTLALFVTILLAAQLSLRSTAKKLILCILVVPVAVFKNSLRIVTLSSLAIYVDPGFLHGQLHHNGGIVFFLAGLMTCLGFLRILTLWERRELQGSPSQNSLNTQGPSVVSDPAPAKNI